MASAYASLVFIRLATGPRIPRRLPEACMIVHRLREASYSFSISVKRRIRLSSAPTSMVSFTRVSPAAAAFFRRSSIRRLWPAIILPTAAASSWASSRARRLVLASCSVCARRVRTAACSASTAAFRSASCPLSAAMAAASVRHPPLPPQPWPPGPVGTPPRSGLHPPAARRSAPSPSNE